LSPVAWQDADGARDLAERDKHEFQKWIVATIGGQPYKGGKKGMDRGIDGYLHFRDAENKPQLGIISVKGGATNSGHVRDLKGTMEREGASLGVFLTLNPPSREMQKEAASAGARMIQALRSGILILIVPPTFMSLSMIFIVYRKRNQFRRADDAPDSDRKW